jgi:hypothetical protein
MNGFGTTEFRLDRSHPMDVARSWPTWSRLANFKFLRKLYETGKLANTVELGQLFVTLLRFAKPCGLRSDVAMGIKIAAAANTSATERPYDNAVS